MSGRSANCPNCGAPIVFLWSGAVQTTCSFCKSILVRTDVNLEAVGKVADLPIDVSPIQILTEGVFDKRKFQVIGRILYEYEQGGWNEWHCIFPDGTSGWLSDAQLDYDVSFLVPPSVTLPQGDFLYRGQRLTLNGIDFQVTSMTHAHYRGVEGELPFVYWDKTNVLFADLRSTEGKFATIDYSDPEPLLFVGEAVDYTDLQLKNVRKFEGWD